MDNNQRKIINRKILQLEEEIKIAERKWRFHKDACVFLQHQANYSFDTAIQNEFANHQFVFSQYWHHVCSLRTELIREYLKFR